MRPSVTRRQPLEPPPSRWAMPAVDSAGRDGFVAIGADLQPGTVLAAYRSGLFPMPADIARPRRSRTGIGGRPLPMAWWSPDPRGVLPLDGLVVSRSLRRSLRRFEVRVDTAFDAVVERCAAPGRPGGWITGQVRRAYGVLHELGWAHSVEAWSPEGELVGGLYGVAVGGLFAGESMFHVRGPQGRDASKVALVRLVEMLRAAGAAESRLLDVQWPTPHLASLGVAEVPRADYLRRLEVALALPQPDFG